MEIIINSNANTSDLKQVFSTSYPYLKIEFFRKPHKGGQASPKREMYTTDHPVSEVGFNGHEGVVQLRPDMSLAELEKSLFEGFGLCVQVFRKSGKVWLETSATDYLSLESQNALGMEKERPLENEKSGEIDLNEQP